MNAIGFFALVLFIAGSIIAWVGDRLGTYIGKKRLTTFGLRPRHTAMLYTIASGGVIALLTLGFLNWYDQDFHNALLYGRQTMTANRALRQERQALDQRVALTESRAASDLQKAQEATQKFNEAVKRLDPALHKLHAAQGQLAKSRTSLRQRQQQLQIAQQRLSQVKADLGDKQHRLVLAQNSLEKAQRGLAAAKQQYAQAGRAYVEAQRHYLTLAKKTDELLVRNDLLTQQNAGLEGRNKQLAALNGQLTAQNLQLSSQNTALATQVASSQDASLIFHKGEELGRCVIPTSHSLDTIRRDLADFISGLNDTARKQAGRAILVDAIIGPKQQVSLTGVGEQDRLDSLAEYIARQSFILPSIVVIARVQYNTFLGDSTKIALETHDNILVFPDSAVIATEAIDGSQPENVILSALQAFLTSRVQPRALERGIIPVRDPQTGELSVGVPIDSAQWLQLVKQIKQIGAGAQVTATAVGDTLSSGPLRLHLSVSPPAASPVAVSRIRPS